MSVPEISLHMGSGDGLSLHFAACGQPGQPLVVFLHGFPEAWFAWERQLLALGVDHYAIAPDLRGINRSDKPAALRDYRAQRAASDVVALAASLGYREFALVGHDWGAAIAYALAIAHPQRVRRLAILNGVHPAVFARELAAAPAQVAASAYIKLFRRPDAAATLRQDDFAYLLRMFADENGRMPAWLDDAASARYRQAWSQPGALDGGLNYYRATTLHPADGTDAPALDVAALRVDAPTLMLWGDRDRYLLPGCAQGVERHVPRLRVQHFPHCSHWIAHEEPEAVAQLLREHITAP